MFYPQEMTQIEIIVPTKDLLPVTKMLSGQGVFNQTDVNYLGNEKDNAQPDQWQEKMTAYSILERRTQSIINSLEIHDGSPKNREYGSLADIEKLQAQVDEIEHKVRGTVEKINEATKLIEHNRNLLQQIEPLADVAVDFSQLRDSKYTSYVLGMMPLENIERLKTSLSRIPFAFYTLSQKGQKAVVFIATSHNNYDVLSRAVRSAYFDPIRLPSDLTGTPAQIADSLNASFAETEKEITTLKETLADIRKENETQLVDLLWDVRCSRMMTNAIMHYGHLKYTYIIVGWIFTSYVQTTKEKLKDISKDILIETHNADRRKDIAEVPTALVNPRAFRPFQMLVTTYAQPRYNELDPTPMVAILFPLLFGAMFGDVGHGLLLALLGGLITSKKVKMLNSLTSLGPIIMACGVVAMIFGFLYGSIFGYEDILKPIWMRPSSNIMSILITTIIAGVILLSFGFLLNLYVGYRDKQWVTTTFGHNGLVSLILYWSLLGLVASLFVTNFPISNKIFIITAAISGLGLMFSELIMNLIDGHRPLFEGGFATYLIQIVFELIEALISFLSNSLSFVRVGAFAVAHGYLAGVFFVLALMVDPNKGIGYWLMFFLGLLFIVGFEGLIVGIQTMRLTYYEIFGKFFNGGGKHFEPLTLHPAENE